MHKVNMIKKTTCFIERKAKKKNISKYINNILVYMFLTIISFIFIYPYIFIISNSLKSLEDFYNISVIWIPEKFMFSNFIIAFKQMDVLLSLKNSLILTVSCTIAHIISCSFIGYGFGRKKGRLKNLLFIVVVLSIIIPLELIYIPSYALFAGKYGWRNSILPLLIPSFFGYGLKGGLYIYIFKQYYASFPSSIEEAAKIDGCGAVKTFIRIILSMSKTPITVVSVLSMIWHWNDYSGPNSYLTSLKNMVLPQRVEEFYRQILAMRAITEVKDVDERILNNAVLSAMMLIAILPVLLIYLFLQRKFIEGVETTGIKS